MSEHLLEERRENWGSRASFVLAAIGSAVGLGNLWGFPHKVYSTGGGAFLIPYVLAMVLIGIPLLIAEFSLGHLTQRATPDAFGRANRKFAFIGWWQIVLGFIIITFYAVVLAWCMSFLYYSVQGIFTGSLPWASTGAEGVQVAQKSFYQNYLHKHDSLSLGGIQWPIVGVLALTWLAMHLCIFRGVRLLSKVVMWTVPLPWLMLLILTIRGITLNGSMQGLEFYLEPNWSKLAEPNTWRMAFGQMFFSMSLAFGIMVTYASFLHRKSDINNNAAVIGLADLATSFIAGIAVFATIGGMAHATMAQGNPVPPDRVIDSGWGMAFVAFPYALAQLPHAQWFSTIFFASLLLLGIDSAFSITESVLASVVDKTGWSRDKTLIGITLLGFLVGVIYCTQGGLNWLGTVADFIYGTFGIAFMGLLECVVLGWLFRLRRLRAHANERSDWSVGAWWTWIIRVVIPLVMAALFAWSLFDDWSNPEGYLFNKATGKLNLANAIGLAVMGIAPILAVVISSLKFKSASPAELIVPEYSDDQPRGKNIGLVAILAAAASLVLLIVTFATMLCGASQLRAADTAPPAIAGTIWILLLAAGATAMLALLLGGITVVKLEAKTIKTSMTARFGAALGILMVGLGAGLTLAMFMLSLDVKTKPVQYDGELGADAWIILAVMLGLLVAGLGWCFYRAIRGASTDAYEQKPEEV